MSYANGLERLTHWKAIILERTDGGALILEKLYPSIRFKGGKTDHFRIRESDHTPSAIAKLHNGVWSTCDYGGDGRWRNAIDQYAFERGMEGADWEEKLKAVANEFLIVLP